jgi:hypothetical protein
MEGNKENQTDHRTSPSLTTQETWAQNPTGKAHAFANHLTQIFSTPLLRTRPWWKRTTHPKLRKPLSTRSTNQPSQNNLSPSSHQQHTSQEITRYDLVTGRILKELPTIGIQYLTQIFNAVLLKGCFPAQWKVVQIILILKPGKLFTS